MSDNEVANTPTDGGSDSSNNNNNNNNNEYERVCYMCHRPESKVDKMIVIPNNICICSDCMQNTLDQISASGFPGMQAVTAGHHEYQRDGDRAAR